ncbi:uncharacterized protein DUF1707 [Herbihabitans rhizosphaerae]|uniref:Uncharacterized protein DUF1707 n=1 Tax=Herbihabitans rhizosphaerae TaxID=1872711 RepID=A0A4Q7KK17_9PSEU|nr:DUF1707 domain-containing protein [Herbihabitans rhizosphaerae]RZS36938.1 uncharacterized protein DUF1707 [Herbihabitans rhizosphaerae]
MSTPAEPPVRASDSEREEIAARVQAAGAEGRLSLAETEERLTSVYTARFRHELTTLTSDLPSPQPARGPARAPAVWQGQLAGRRNPLAVHAAIVTLISVMLIVRWVASPIPYFWPIFPMFWLAMSLLVHARIRRSGWARRRLPTG